MPATMTVKEFEEKWAGMTLDDRFRWAMKEFGADRVAWPLGSLALAYDFEYELSRRGKADEYGLTLQSLIEEAYTYGAKTRGAQYYRLAHADAEVRCKAALMVVLGVKV